MEDKDGSSNYTNIKFSTNTQKQVNK